MISHRLPLHVLKAGWITLLLGLSSLSLEACFTARTSSTLSSFKRQELEQAIFFLEGNLGSLGEVGYTHWTPTTAASELVHTMNAAAVLLPEEEEEYRQAGITPKDAIPYVLHQPTGPWQIVLIPNDAQQTIHVKAFGPDLETPVIEQDLPCCSP